MDVSNRKWQRVYRWLLAYIDENKFTGNQKLPSENTLCRRLNVSRETVRLAMDQLEEENLITRVRGSGTFFNKEVAMSRELSRADSQIKIGLILQGQDGGAESELIRGVRSMLKKDEQAELKIFLTDNKFANERRCLQTVMHQNFSGFIVDGVKASMASPNLYCYRELQRHGIPLIFYNNYYQSLRCPKVGVNNMVCAEQLVGRLVQAGHRHIAGIFVFDNYQSVEKFHGMYESLRRHGVEFQDDYIKWCISNEAHDDRFGKNIIQFLKSVPKCTAIVCCNYRIYRLVRNVLEKTGKRVPEDYSIVCFDYSSDNWAEEKVTCSIHQAYRLGAQAAKLLLQMINRGECNERDYSLMMRPEIYEGDSIGVIPAKKDKR